MYFFISNIFGRALVFFVDNSISQCIHSHSCDTASLVVHAVALRGWIYQASSYCSHIQLGFTNNNNQCSYMFFRAKFCQIISRFTHLNAKPQLKFVLINTFLIYHLTQVVHPSTIKLICFGRTPSH